MSRPLSKKVKEELRLRVEAGAAYLAVMHPKWFNHIKSPLLNLSNHDYCLLGQLGGGYSEGADEFGVTRDEDKTIQVVGNGEIIQAEAMGFFVSNKDPIQSDKYDELTRLWKLKIAQLKRKAKKR